MKPRKIRKVYYAFYDSETESSAYPVIRIAGRFLEKLGFRIGEAIAVHYEKHCITIMKTEEPLNDKVTNQGGDDVSK